MAQSVMSTPSRPTASASSSLLATVPEHAPTHVTRAAARRAGFQIKTPKHNSSFRGKAGRNDHQLASNLNHANSGSTHPSLPPHSDLSKPTISSLSRQRTLNTSAAAAALKATSTSLSARKRSVLGEAKNVSTIQASASSRSLASVTSTPHRKVSRAEASQMTGMGIIRVGPAVQSQRTSPKKALLSNSNQLRHDSGSSSDPYSIAFVRPQIEQLGTVTPLSDENGHHRASPALFARQHSSASSENRAIASLPSVPLPSVENLLTRSPRPAIASFASPNKLGNMLPNKELAQSPARRRLFGAGENIGSAIAIELSPPVKRSATKDCDGQVIEVDRLPVLPSSPAPHAQTPRTLIGQTRKQPEGDRSDGSEDEIDCFSPRKKLRQSDPMSPVRAAPSFAQTPTFGLPAQASPGQLRSPPKRASSTPTLTTLSTVSSATPRIRSPSPGFERPSTTASPLPSSSAMMATPKATPTSVPMVRSPGIRFPPSPLSSRLKTMTPGAVDHSMTSASTSAPITSGQPLATPVRPSVTPFRSMPTPTIVLPDSIDPRLLSAAKSPSSSSFPFSSTSTSASASGSTLPTRSPSSSSLQAPKFAPIPMRPVASPAHTRSYLQRRNPRVTASQSEARSQPHGQPFLGVSPAPRSIPSPSRPSPSITLSAPTASTIVEPASLSAAPSSMLTTAPFLTFNNAPDQEMTTIDPACLTAATTVEADEQGDVSMSSTSTSNGDTSSLSNSGNRSMSEETSKRLANLQSMLSRLSMPRPVTPVEDINRGGSSSFSGAPGGARAPPSNLADLKARRERTKALTAQFREEYTVPISDEPSQRSALRTSVPPTIRLANANSLGMGPPPSGRRRSSSATRGSNGIIDTSSRGGPLLATSSAPAVLVDASSGSNGDTTQTVTESITTTTMIKQTRRVSGGPTASSTSTATIAASITEGEVTTKARTDVLRGVVAFVDVRTLEGDDAGMVFTDMLLSMGARVTSRPTLSLTHIVFKSGRPGTLQRYRTHTDPKPHLVGISWVVRCAELNQRVNEADFMVEAGKEELFQKKRRSMEPKPLSALNAPPGVVLAQSTDPGLKATIAASLERARRRSLQFAPKVGSPLAKRAFVMVVEQENEDDEVEGCDEPR